MLRKTVGTGVKIDGQTSVIEDPEIKWQCYTHLIFDKGGKNTLWKIEPIEQMVVAKLHFCLQKMKLDLYLSPYTKLIQNGSNTLT